MVSLFWNCYHTAYKIVDNIRSWLSNQGGKTLDFYHKNIETFERTIRWWSKNGSDRGMISQQTARCFLLYKQIQNWWMMVIFFNREVESVFQPFEVGWPWSNPSSKCRHQLSCWSSRKFLLVVLVWWSNVPGCEGWRER